MPTKTRKISRGERNNNPGNIRISKDKWQGLSTEQLDKEFFTFKDPTYGIRAMARILIKYQDSYNANTVRKIVRRWAPPVENDTEAYIERVCELTSFDDTQELNMHNFDHLRPIVIALINHELGYQPYTEAQITKGIVLAGVEPTALKEKSIANTNTVKVAAVGSAVTVASPILTIVEKYEEHSKTVDTLLNYGPSVLAVLGVILFGYFVYTRWDDRRKGIR